MKSLHAAALLLLAAAGSARAEVRQAAPDGFFVAFSEPVAATPARTYAALAALPAWWSDEHTWSGKASNLSLQAQAGGCFCERWDGGSAEHGRVVMALPDRLLRLDAALGPLQEFALKGILSFWIRTDEDDGSTRLDVEYRVNGAGGSGLDGLAPKVDDMLGQQVARLKRYIETGRPDLPSAPAAGDAAAEAAKAAPDRAILAEWARQAAQEAAAANAAAAPKAAAPAKAARPSKRKPAPARAADGP